MLRVVQVDRSAPVACRSFLTGQRLRVRDYHCYPPDYQGGQVWRFDLRLRLPHGSANPGGFDYESWLFSQRITATGSVHGKPTLVAAHGDGFTIYLLSVRFDAHSGENGLKSDVLLSVESWLEIFILSAIS